MAITPSSKWREIGDVTFDDWRSTIEKAGGNAELSSRASWEAARPHSAILLNNLRAESHYGTNARRNNPTITKNPFSLRRYNEDGTIDWQNEDNPNGYLHFATWQEGVEAAKMRITDAEAFRKQTHGARNPYTATVTLADLISAFSPPEHNDTADIIRKSVAFLNDRHYHSEGETVSDLVYGLVPEPPYIDMIVRKDRPGQGYDVCPPRENIGLVPHETQGDPAGEGVVELEWYRSFFSCPNGERCSNALVDWCCARDGTAARFNDPNGTREPWASGGAPNWSDPDGAAWMNRFGSGKRNEILESVEFIKTDNARLTAAQIAWGAARCAYIADQDKQPWDEYPRPLKHGGTLQLIEHRKLSLTSCNQHPDDLVAMIAQARAIMKRYQTGGGTVTTRPPKPEYAKPVPIEELAFYAEMDDDLVPATVQIGKHLFVFVSDRVKAIRDTRRRQYAYEGSPSIGPDVKEGYDFYVRWFVEASDGREYYITPYWTRILVEDTERIQD